MRTTIVPTSTTPVLLVRNDRENPTGQGDDTAIDVWVRLPIAGLVNVTLGGTADQSKTAGFPLAAGDGIRTLTLEAGEAVYAASAVPGTIHVATTRR